MEEVKKDSLPTTGCGVIVIKDGKILIGERKDNGQICGPGGHIEIGETPEDAARILSVTGISLHRVFRGTGFLQY